MTKKPLYIAVAQALHSYQFCISAAANPAQKEYATVHRDRLIDLVKENMPSGSGVDCGTKLDLDASTPDKLVFTFSFHHMDQNGMYCDWTDHKAIVTASLAHGFDLRITGRDKNSVKDYLQDTFHFALSEEVE